MEMGRVNCPECGAACLRGETACWRCGTPFSPAGGKADPQKASAEKTSAPPIRFSEEIEEPAGRPESASAAPPAAPPSMPINLAPILFGADEGPEEPGAPAPPPASEAPPTPATTLIWFGAETEKPAAPPEVPAATRVPPVELRPEDAPSGDVAATIGGTTISAELGPELMRLTFCKHCGHQNAEGAVECARCRTPLEVVAAGFVGELAPVPRTWAFDVLGAAWLILGFAAVYCGRFLLKADPNHQAANWSDYLWTGVVACIPGALVIARHYFCKLLFWAMALAALLVWLTVGFMWLFVGLHVTDNGSVGLAWLGVLTGLTWISYLTVRANDEFDAAS